MPRTFKLATVILMTASAACVDSGEPGLSEHESQAEVIGGGAVPIDEPVYSAVNPANLIPTITCTPPSQDNCTNDQWQKQCASKYRNSTSLCDYYNHQTVAREFGSAALTEKVFDPSIDNFVDALPPPQIPAPDQITAVANSWAAQEEKAHLQAQIDPNALWSSYIRPNIGTLTEGAPVPSCENYIYRSYYDVERWIDAVNACKGDAKCIVTASLWSMPTTGPSTKWPGIGRRVLRDALDTPLDDASHLGGYTGDEVKVSERDSFTPDYKIEELPKNIFYANTEWFITPKLLKAFPSNGVDGPREQVQKLLNELHRGAKLYELDGKATGFVTDEEGYLRRNFADEWAFHKFGNSTTTNITNGEMREYARRRQKVQDAWNLIGDLFKCKTLDQMEVGGACGPKTVNAMGKVEPGDTQMWENDPFAFNSIVGQIKPEAFLAPPSLQGSVGFGTRVSSSPLTLNELSTITTGVDLLGDTLHLPGLVTPSAQALMAPAPSGVSGTNSLVVINPYNPLNFDAPYADPEWKNSLSSIRGVMDMMWDQYPPTLDPTKPYPALKCDAVPSRINADTVNVQETWQPVCIMVNTLLEEWWRKINNKPSCLDSKSTYCDWTPDMFVDRYVAKNIGYGAAAKEYEYNECKRWTNGGKFDDPSPAIAIPAASRTSSLALRNLLKYRKQNFLTALKNVPVRAPDQFGKLRIDQERIGNSDFGGGYNYQLGWNLKLFRDSAHGPVCRMGGSTVTEFQADARLFGHKVSILDARTAVSSNENDSGKAFGDAHLKVVGIDFFDTMQTDLGLRPGHVADGTVDGKVDLGAGSYFDLAADGGKETVFTAAAQVSWVTITVTVGAYYKYGTQVLMTATLPTKNVCGTNFKLYSSLTPFAELGAWADVDATIIGFGAGLEVTLELLGLKLPLTTNLEVKDINGIPHINFLAKLDLVLETLKGELALYIKAFGIKVASFELVRWKGFEHTFPIFRTKDTNVRIDMLDPSIVRPIAGKSDVDPCPANTQLTPEGICK